MRIAPEGWPFIRVALSLDLALAVVWFAWPGWTAALLVVGLVVTVWVAAFFRDPERRGERGDALVVAPADGRICSITQVDEPMYLHRQTTRISIFMSVFNVHVNRFPVSGEVEVVHYNPGEFTVASHDMDIRGAGNLLGDEQSGHIREVGIELYQQMLEEELEAI